jgi:hypothetical protein
MTDTTWRGVPLIEAGDGILTSLALLANNLNVGVPVASIAAARTLLTQAEADGVAPTSSNPALFMVGEGVKRVLYTSDGSKTGGVWALSPVNEPSRARFGRGEDSGVTRSLSQGDTLTVISGALPSAPYDRAISMEAICYGSVTGNIWLRIYPPGEAYVSARFSSGDQQSQPLPARGKILAGQSPELRVAVVGGAGGGSITFGTTADNTVLFVDAFPITMA